MSENVPFLILEVNKETSLKLELFINLPFIMKHCSTLSGQTHKYYLNL